MKKIFKKIISMAMIAIIAASFATISAGAYNIGDVINYAQPTDIIATINGYQLMSFNVDGFTYIVAEDLKHYGFTVNYDNATRSLSIQRNSAVTAIAPHNTNAAFWNIGSNKTNKNILYTDIVTYVANNYVPSYNIDGATIIKFDELSRFGAVAYDNTKREISLTVSDIVSNQLGELVNFLYTSGTVAEMQNEINATAKETYGNNASCEFFLRAKGNVLVFEMYLRNTNVNATQKASEQAALYSEKANMKEMCREFKQIVPELDAIALILYDVNNVVVAADTISAD